MEDVLFDIKANRLGEVTHIQGKTVTLTGWLQKVEGQPGDPHALPLWEQGSWEQEAANLRPVNDQEWAVHALRGWMPIGSTVWTVLRHVSRSGMMRVISVHTLYRRKPDAEQGKCLGISDLTRSASRVLGWRIHRDRDGIVVSGCGMDMGFHLVYELAQCLWGNGYALEQKWI